MRKFRGLWMLTWGLITMNLMSKDIVNGWTVLTLIIMALPLTGDILRVAFYDRKEKFDLD